MCSGRVSCIVSEKWDGTDASCMSCTRRAVLCCAVRRVVDDAPMLRCFAMY